MATTRQELIDRFFKQRLEEDARHGGYPYVTISRQAGSGGHALADLVLQRIEQKRYADPYRGWRVFDREIGELLREDRSLSRSARSLLTEEYHSEFEEYFKGLLGGPADQDRMMHRMFETVDGLASIGKVILVGHGGTCATARQPGGIRVRVTAPEQYRAERLAADLKLPRREAQEITRRHDQEHHRMYRVFFDKDIDDASLYDLVFDASETEMSEAAARVFDLVAARATP